MVVVYGKKVCSIFKLELLSLLTLIPYLAAYQNEYNISKYTSPLPEDIKHIVQRALLLEKGENLHECRNEEKITCPAMKFRHPSGKCNNVRHPTWGTRGQKFLRLSKPNYIDGKSPPQELSTSFKLPSPIRVSSVLQKSSNSHHESVTALLGAWSELLLHDLASTGNMKSQHCCDDSKRHKECYRMLENEKCKEYMRTLPSVDMHNCKFDYRNQMNLASSFLDASAIYGNTLEEMNTLRTNIGGKVNISSCLVCVFNPLYTALMKEHNRVAMELGKINKQWKDDAIFFESRRIVTAEIQHITYNEFLPLVLGQETMIQSQLELKKHGRFSKYSSRKRAEIFNEVAVTALPIMLSLIPDTLANKSSKSFTDMLAFLIKTAALKPSPHISLPVRHDWDTFALFLHMSRDHGIPSYTKYLQLCHNVSSTSPIRFHELEKFGIGDTNIKYIKELYEDVNAIDLIVGGILEDPIPGALLGPTFNCILKQQFQLLKESDRFWYENDLPPSSFTINQLKEIKRVTLSGLLCANSPNLKRLQPRSFLQEDLYLNSRIACDQYQLPALSEWTELEHVPELTEDLFKEALSKAQENLIERRKMEYKVWSEVGGVNPKSPQGTAVAFSKASKEALNLANTSLLFELASNEIVNTLVHHRRKRHLIIEEELPFLRNELTESLQNIDLANFLPNFNHPPHINMECNEQGPCDPTTPFRTYSGHCNNLRNPNYGKALATFNRLLPSAYEDGISKAKITGVTGLPLPNPRIVSRVIHPDISNIHSRYTLMTMQFAQLLDHDLTLTPVHKGFEESIPDCRSCDSRFTVHPECDPLPIPPGDDYYPEFNVTTGEKMCLHSMRSLPGQQHFGPREQINMNSAFLDGSMIYGENLCKIKMLRGQFGYMNYTVHPVRGKDLLPQTHKHPECKSHSGLCFNAGDPRASEQPALTAIHTIFMREHNRINDILSKLNPHWDEDKLFEHVRRIVIAEFQQMTYNEFLPRILGWNAMNLYELKLSPNGYFKGYNPNCNPTIVNEFAAAAFRIGHSLLRPHIPRVNANYEVVNPPILLRDGFFKMDMMLQESMVDEITRGLISTPIETLDQFITGEVTNHLFEDRRIPFSGIDLISRNLQRARDHGIPSYNSYRAYCNLKRASSFEDLAREMSADSISRLKSIYASVDDIDLFPGGMSETSLKGGMVGPTFGCIIAIQFRQLKKCDRFWFENDDPVVRFTEHQLAEIRKISLAKVICDNLDVEGYIQRYAFDLPSNFLNPRVPCHSLPSINLHAWKEFTGDQGCLIGEKYVRVGASSFVSPCTNCICTPQGGNCASIKITDCHRLLRFWSKEAILKDEVCTAQCGFLLRDALLPSFNSINHRTPNNLRSRFPLLPSHHFNDYTEIDFSDVSHFLNKCCCYICSS